MIKPKLVLKKVKGYEKPQAGELVLPFMQRYKMACCDCELVHIIKFSVIEKTKMRKDGRYEYKELKAKKWGIGMRVWRDNRSTAALRREVKKGQNP